MHLHASPWINSFRALFCEHLAWLVCLWRTFILIDGKAAKELWIMEHCESWTDLGRYLRGGSEGDLRTETPEERDTSKGIKGRCQDTNSFNICLKLSLLRNPNKGRVRKTRKEKISLAYLMRLLISCHNPFWEVTLSKSTFHFAFSCLWNGLKVPTVHFTGRL